MFQYHHQSSSSSRYQFHSSYYKSYYDQSTTGPTTLVPPPMGQPYRRTGRVKFFNLNKGYGFIIPSIIYKEGGSSSKGSSYEDEQPTEEEGKF
jgi:hypothetical protein